MLEIEYWIDMITKTEKVMYFIHNTKHTLKPVKRSFGAVEIEFQEYLQINYLIL